MDNELAEVIGEALQSFAIVTLGIAFIIYGRKHP